MNPGLLSGKSAIVTGGGSGIGRAICLLFKRHGANVLVADLNREAALQTVAAAGTSGMLALQADVTDEASVSAMAAAATRSFGAIDILINCAGMPQTYIPIEEMTSEKWDTVMNVNAKSIFLTVKHCAPGMKERRSGSIVNIASIVGERAKPGMSAYCASKGAAIVLTKSLALELAPHNIRVNAINPGACDTPMLGQFLDPNRCNVNTAMNEFARNIPLGVLVQPEDVAQAALYLASPDSKIVTGAVLDVDGGRGV